MIGRLTKEVDLRYTSVSNTPVASFTLAVNRRFTQEGQPQADFISIVAWNKTAEFVAKYFTKGLQVAIVGRLQTRYWDDNEGKRHYVTEVVADETYFADSKRDSSTDDNLPDSYEPPISKETGTNNDDICPDCHKPMSQCDCLPF